MSVKFDVKLTSEDMYRFNMYHMYTSLQGILSLVVGAFIIGVLVVSDQFTDVMSALPYIAIACIFVLYIPITLRFRSKRQMLMSDVLKETLQYELAENGVTVSVANQEEKAVLPWSNVYKIVMTKKQVLIYSNRVNAYIIPRSQVETIVPDMIQAFTSYCEDYKLKIKR